MAGELDPWYDSIRSAVQQQVAGDYIFSDICISSVTETFPDINFSWTEPVIPGYTTGETYNLTLSVTATANVCDRSVSMQVVLTGINKFQLVTPRVMNRSTSSITPSYVDSRCPVNGVYQLCSCSTFSKGFTTPENSGYVVVTGG